MLLSMHIISDYFQDTLKEQHIQSRILDISTTRIFQPNTPRNNETVYIGTSDTIFQDGQAEIVLIHEEDWIRLNTTDLQDVTNTMLNLIESFSAWDHKMMKVSSSSSMTQDLIDCATEHIPLPFFLLDSGQRLLAISHQYGANEVDHLWYEMMMDGAANLEFLTQIHQTLPISPQSTELRYLKNEEFPNPIYQKNFFLRDNLVGQACLIDLYGNVTMGQLHIFELLCSHIDHWFQSNVQAHTEMQLQLYLQSAVTDPDADNSELIWQLKLQGWKEDDELLLVKLDAAYHTYNINEHLCRSINTLLDGLHATALDFSICVLCNLSITSKEVIHSTLEKVLRSSKYYAVYSHSFTLKDSFSGIYELLDIASQHCEKQVGTMYDGHKYLHFYLIRELQKNISSDQLHPALKRLRTYDTDHHSDFYQTLKTYLELERSPVATAKALKLHRNSLAYRLEKIYDIIQVNLDDPLIRFYLLLSFFVEDDLSA